MADNGDARRLNNKYSTEIDTSTDVNKRENRETGET
jgi:hypothetical protein